MAGNSTCPGSKKQHRLSTCPNVSSLVRPRGSQITCSTPRIARKLASMSCFDRCGLRLGSSRHCSVVRSVPSPSTWIEPPSRICGPDDPARPGQVQDAAGEPGVAGEALERESPGVEAPVDAGEPAVLDHETSARCRASSCRRALRARSRPRPPSGARHPRRPRPAPSASPVRTGRSRAPRSRRPRAPDRDRAAMLQVGRATPSSSGREGPTRPACGSPSRVRPACSDACRRRSAKTGRGRRCSSCEPTLREARRASGCGRRSRRAAA